MIDLHSCFFLQTNYELLTCSVSLFSIYCRTAANMKYETDKAFSYILDKLSYEINVFQNFLER